MNPPQSSFEFGVSIAPWLAFALMAGAIVLAWAFWRSRLNGVPPKRRATLIALRVAAIAIVVFMLLDPTLIHMRSQPAEDYVVLLFDDSRSMKISGDDGVSRGKRLLDGYTAARAAFESKLRDFHHLAFYRFGQTPSRLARVGELSFNQTESGLTDSINGALRDLAGAKVAGVVVFSDGVEQTGDLKPDPVSSLSPGTPVFTVGVDTPAPWRDLELKAVSVARTNFDKSPVALTASISAEGLKGRSAVVEALEGNRVVASKAFEISDDPMETKIRLDFTPVEKGWLEYHARLRLLDVNPSPTPGPNAPAANPATLGPERIVENNERGFVVDNREKTFKILYFSGRPNWENKFAFRALEDDPQLDLTSLVRVHGPIKAFQFRGELAFGLSNPIYDAFDDTEVVAPRYDESVFLRISHDNSEVVGGAGYPEQASDLFPYDLIIFGDIEAGFFSPQQMQLTRDFVSKRGGSFLMIGGPATLAEGKYAGTMIEGMLPVVLGSGSDAASPDLKSFVRPEPTVEGQLSGIWSLDPDPAKNEAMWDELPPLYGINEFPMLRAGASELARAVPGGTEDKPPSAGRPQPLFVWQRFGLGRSAVLATGETWQWKMQTDPDNTVHDKFWRQMVRGLVNDVPSPIELKSSGKNLTVDQPAKLEFLVRDPAFDKKEGLNTTVQETPPGGTRRELVSEESISDVGVYTADLTPDKPGMHLIDMTAQNEKSETVGTVQEAVYVDPDLREYRDAAYNPDYLKSLSKATGGAFYTLDQLGKLADAIPKTASKVEIPEFDHLWRFPPFYLALAAIFAVEWYLRRRAGQP